MILTFAKHGKYKVNSVSQMAMILFISALGFVGSALVAYSGGLLTGSNGSYQLSFHSLPSVALGFLICMFAGPFITAEQGLAYWREGLFSSKALSFAVCVSLVWSFCSGILIVQFLAYMGFLTV